MLIDLHTHSTESDGTCSPSELLAQARAAGLDVLAITDHDTTASWQPAEVAALHTGVSLVRGTEVSAHLGSISVHILSYLHDPTFAPLATELARIRTDRKNRARNMVARLNADLGLTWEDVMAQTGGGTVGRPHIADALIAQGLASSREEAFSRYLHPAGPYYVRHYSPDARQAIALIQEAGGVAVFAHPGARCRGEVASDDDIGELAAIGLAGLEVRHRDNDGAEQERLCRIAKNFGLLRTGASDYHGSGKVNRLAENTTELRVLQEIAERAMGRVIWA